ncbi:MAG TPA: low specificity L-threonine aldolase, partial [Opitutus sp.]|nr:low specificity L-threonine aldolase [Opitutus sp.]
NTAGICPEAWTALHEANTGHAPSYGDDMWTSRAKQQFRELFETDCDVFFVFNGTAANALALAVCCRSPHTRVICHDYAHIDTDECGAPEFFTRGAKLNPIAGVNGKLHPADVERALHRGHDVHYPKPAALSLTQSTEWGTVYTPAELRELASLAHAHGLAVHLDGARFANAMAALQQPGTPNPKLGTLNPKPGTASPADATWRAGVDVLCFGGTKNGMHNAEAVVFFNRDLAREFDYRVKQSGQLSSKMRFAAAQWSAMLHDSAWLRHAAHANAQARKLANALRELPSLRLIAEPEVNGVFVEMPQALYDALTARGWHFYRFIGEHGYRLMCSWATTDAQIDGFIADLRRA